MICENHSLRCLSAQAIWLLHHAKLQIWSGLEEYGEVIARSYKGCKWSARWNCILCCSNAQGKWCIVILWYSMFPWFSMFSMCLIRPSAFEPLHHFCVVSCSWKDGRAAVYPTDFPTWLHQRSLRNVTERQGRSATKHWTMQHQRAFSVMSTCRSSPKAMLQNMTHDKTWQSVTKLKTFVVPPLWQSSRSLGRRSSQRSWTWDRAIQLEIWRLNERNSLQILLNTTNCPMQIAKMYCTNLLAVSTGILSWNQGNSWCRAATNSHPWLWHCLGYVVW